MPDVVVITEAEIVVVGEPATSVVTVDDPSTVVVVEAETVVVEDQESFAVVEVGIQGPAGPQGAGGIQGPAGPQGVGGPLAVATALVSVVWGTPAAEVANVVEVPASCVDFDGTAFASGIVDVQIKVTDGAADADVSSTATIAAAATPVGTLLSGSGTATVVMRTNAAGLFRIAVAETAVGFRYLWVNAGGQARLWVRSSTGVLELAFA